MIINDYVEDLNRRRTVTRTQGLMTSSVIGSFENEYVWFLSFNETGTQITEIVEFMDSRSAVDIMERIKSAA